MASSLLSMGPHLAQCRGALPVRAIVAGAPLRVLTQLDLPIYLERRFDDPNVPGDLTVTIQATQNATVHVSNGYNYSDSGIVAVPANPVLGRTTVPAARIVELTDLSNPPPPLHISFLLPPLLIKGQTYAIVVESTGTARHDWMISQTTDVNAYPNDNMLFQADGPNTQWYNYTYQPYVGAPHIAYIEAAFTTVHAAVVADSVRA